MSDQHRLDVWVIKANRIYRNVPYAVVADRIQQGRLLPDDKVSTAGTNDWRRMADDPLLSPYLPRPVPHRADDRAEALEPVEVDFSWKSPQEEEQDDPDMIPLIDISLVLLIFFVMTAGSLIGASVVETPAAENARVRSINPKETVAVSVSMLNNQVRYFIEDEGERALTQQELLGILSQKMKEGTVVDAVVKANPWLPYETVRDLLAAMERIGIKRIQAGVRDKRADEEK